MPHDKNGVELKAGDRVTVECVVEEVNATPDHCNVKLKTVEPFHPNKEGKTNWFNTKQVVKVGLVVFAVLLASSLAGAAPPQTAAEQQEANKSALASVLSRLDKAEARLDALEGKAGVKAQSCGCDEGKRCTCGGSCLCPPPGRKADKPTIVKGYHEGKECWVPEGYEMPGWVRHDAMVSDCSSGVCRMVKASDLYGAKAAPATTHQPYYSAPLFSPSTFGGGYFRGGFGGFAGGGCAGGSCR